MQNMTFDRFKQMILADDSPSDNLKLGQAVRRLHPSEKYILGKDDD